MKTLAQLRDEAEEQEDAIANPRRFLALFPGGAHNGCFIDPFLGVMKIDGLDGVVYTRDLPAHEIPAVWLHYNNP